MDRERHASRFGIGIPHLEGSKGGLLRASLPQQIIEGAAPQLEFWRGRIKLVDRMDAKRSTAIRETFQLAGR
jgi:hypothetical protein